MLQVEAIRPGHVQHQVPDRVRLVVGPPPDVLIVQHVKTRPDLARKVVQQPAADHLEKLGAEGSIHGAE
jgi:hypothetical protein